MSVTWKVLTVAAVLSTAAAAPASAQGWFWGQQEPAAFQAMYPNRDVLNGGAPTPEAQMRAAGRFGAAQPYPNAYAAPRGDGFEMSRAVGHRRRHHARF